MVARRSIAGVDILAGQPSGLAKVALGLTVYNGERYLPYALESILGQNCRDFVIVVLDDCSSDGSVEIIRGYAAQDARVLAFRNPERNGLIGTWVKVFRLCQTHYPNHRYFAWCSDHDVLRPNWLGPLVDILDKRDDVVLAYPRTLHIDTKGRLLPRGGRPTLFDTENITDPFARFHHVNRHMMGAGNMIYGLFRSSILDRIGVYRAAVMPDRLAMLELSLHGHIYQTRPVSRLRRDTAPASIQRQKRSLFTPGTSRHAQRIPWYVSHAILFFRVYSLSDNRPQGCSRLQVGWMSLAILFWQFFAEMKKKRQRALKHVRGFLKRSSMGRVGASIGRTVRANPALHAPARGLKRLLQGRLSEVFGPFDQVPTHNAQRRSLSSPRHMSHDR